MVTTQTTKAASKQRNNDEVLKGIVAGANRLWDMNIYETPEDIASDIREHLDDWLAGFDMSCRCRTPGILCLCPIRRYND